MLSSSGNHLKTTQIHLVTPLWTPVHWTITVTPYMFTLVCLPFPSLFKMLPFGFSHQKERQHHPCAVALSSLTY